MIVRVLWGTLLFFIDSFCEIFKPHHTNPPTIKLFFLLYDHEFALLLRMWHWRGEEGWKRSSFFFSLLACMEKVSSFNGA